MKPLVFLLDVDNTLIDNDSLKSTIEYSVMEVLGSKEAKTFWQTYHQLRTEHDLVDFPSSIRSYCQTKHSDSCDLTLNAIFHSIDFQQALYPKVKQVLAHLKKQGQVWLFSEGDQVYQKRKIGALNVSEFIDGVFLFEHKLEHWSEVEHKFSQSQLVVIEDRSTNLDVIKHKSPGTTTIEVCQGHYSDQQHQPHEQHHITFDSIADVLQAQFNMPSVSVEQMRTIDQLMIEQLTVPVTMMMEHAARAVAQVATRHLRGSVEQKKIVALAHKGHNGGDALAAARILANQGAQVQCFVTAAKSECSPDTQHQWSILETMRVPVNTVTTDTVSELSQQLDSTDLVIDGLLGYNLHGQPREPIAAVIKAVNESSAMVLAIDVPSGMNADTGEAAGAVIDADVTVTLALPKHGLRAIETSERVGALYVADLTVPPALYQQVELKDSVPLVQGSVVQTI